MSLRALLPRLATILLVSFGFPICHAQAPPAPTNPAPANPTPASTVAGLSPADASKQAQKAITAINSAASPVSKASDAITKAGTYTKSIQDITGSTAKSTQSVTDNLQTLKATIDAIDQNKVLNALSTALKDLDPKQTGAESAVNDACDPAQLKQPSSGDQPDVTNALAKCTTAQKDAATTLAAVTPALTGLQTAMQSISPYLAKQFDDLADKLKPFTDAKLISSDPTAAPAGAPAPAVLLQVLPKGLPALKQALDSLGEYKSTWNSMKSVVQSPNVGKAPADATGASGSSAAGPAAKDATPAKSDALDADAELKKLQTTVDSIETNLAAWFAVISTQLQTDTQTLDGKIAPVAADPAKNSADALGVVRDKTDTLASVQSIGDAWPPLVGFLVDGQPPGFGLSTTKKNLADLQTWTNVLRASISRVHDALAGDFSNADADQVSLYYFTDIPRLMYALNENVQTVGGVADAQARAADQRTALTRGELELADAQATVNRYQKQVLDLQEQQRQANEKLKGLNSNPSKLASRLKQAQNDKQTADTNYQSAVDNQKNSATTTTSTAGASSTSPPDPTLAAAVEKDKAKQTAAAAKLSDAQSNYDAAQTDRDNAQAQADDTQNQKDSLPAKLAAAQQALSDGQASVSLQRRKMLLAAQAESDAFAFARDNAPFMFAPADASSSNPAKRVMLYAFNDSKTIFMRGKPDDLAQVKHIISVFDQPAPQARLTLWSFELDADSNGKTNEKAAKSLNESMEIVDDELSNARALENTTLSLLRDVINQEVRVCFKQAAVAEPTKREAGEAEQANQSRSKGNERIEDVKRQDPPVSTALCAAPPVKERDCPDCTPTDFEKLRRITFYDPLVLEQLHLKDEKGLIDVIKLRKLVPDPAGTTTLGEALMILSLAPLQTHLATRNNFEGAVQERFRTLPLSKDLNRCAWFRRDKSNPDPVYDKRCTDYHWVGEKGPCDNKECLLPLTWNRLNIWEQEARGSGTGLTSQQLEITRALNTAYEARQLQQDLNKLQSWFEDIGSTQSRLDKLDENIAVLEDRGKTQLALADKNDLTQLQQIGRSANEAQTARRNDLAQRGITLLPAADRTTYQRLSKQRLQLEARLETIQQVSPGFIEKLSKEMSEKGVDTSDLISKLSAASAEDTKKLLSDLKVRLFQSPTLSSASPRVAAADEMLKQIIIALEDDLDRLFVQPMIKNLRVRLMAAKVRVGILQRESMLASNRGKARVDPKASAQLSVGEEQDILTGVQQLAQLYATVQSGGALAAFGALQEQPQEQQPEIYALTTGNKFEVTPIFDPSGQALRFKFDFVSTTNLQEPNGTTNPQFPRIERHTVNTEVQLSNLETREISRFESNARLGLPTTYWGGIPVLKDIPGVRQPWFPLVGWFVRKGGQQRVGAAERNFWPDDDVSHNREHYQPPGG